MRHRSHVIVAVTTAVVLVPSGAWATARTRVDVPAATPALAEAAGGAQASTATAPATPGAAPAAAPLTPAPGLPAPVPHLPTLPLPAASGQGRRVVYDMGTMHVWLVENDGSVVRDYPVSGHKYRTLPGTGGFWVYSKSRYTGVAHSPTRMEYMVRFAVGESGTGIGFHDIPTKRGKAIESVKSLGQPASHGCVRQSEENAVFLWNWAPIGTPVVVVDTTNRVPVSRPGRHPRGPRPATPLEEVQLSAATLAHA
jgi:lipoprotein-anchoring transpeptidase ErfK/SrfK